MFGDRTPIETQHLEQQVTQTAQKHTKLAEPDGRPHTLAPSCFPIRPEVSFNKRKAKRSIVGKIFARVVLYRLQVLAERVYPEAQCGLQIPEINDRYDLLTETAAGEVPGAETATLHRLHRPDQGLWPGQQERPLHPTAQDRMSPQASEDGHVLPW